MARLSNTIKLHDQFKTCDHLGATNVMECCNYKREDRTSTCSGRRAQGQGGDGDGGRGEQGESEQRGRREREGVSGKVREESGVYPSRLWCRCEWRIPPRPCCVDVIDVASPSSSPCGVDMGGEAT